MMLGLPRRWFNIPRLTPKRSFDMPIGIYPRPTAIERFNKNYIVNPESGCWEWTASLDKKGYGQIYDGNNSRIAHRWIYLYLNPETDRSLVICHKCDNPKCVNPDHLWAGTQRDNIHDSLAKGRMNQGSSSHFSKLTDTDVTRIREMISMSMTDAQISEHFMVGKGTIYDIRRNRSWVRQQPSPSMEQGIHAQNGKYLTGLQVKASVKRVAKRVGL